MIQNFKTKLFSNPSNGIVSFHQSIQFYSSQLIKSKSYISKLQNRSLLVMNGPETYKLLQGLTTNDINLLSSKPLKTKNIQEQAPKTFPSDRVSLYTLFLSPKGKLITDAFIYKPKIFLNGKIQFRQDQLWIDVDSSLKKELFFHLKKYMWKKQVELIDLDKENDEHKPSIYAGFNHISTISSHLNQGFEIEMSEGQLRDQEYANLMMFDPRGGNYGRRILCMQEEFGVPVNDFKLVPQSKYEDFERTIGFSPSSLSSNKLPFQFNYDFLSAISFKKGCYLGQEIISRSYFTGIVRRRVFPFIVNKEDSLAQNQIKQIKQGCKLFNQQKEQVGKVIYYQKGKTGLALSPYLSYFPDGGEQINTPTSQKIYTGQEKPSMLNIEIKAPFEGVVYCPFHRQLENYINQTRKKQKSIQELDI